MQKWLPCILLSINSYPHRLFLILLLELFLLILKLLPADFSLRTGNEPLSAEALIPFSLRSLGSLATDYDFFLLYLVVLKMPFVEAAGSVSIAK